jgi:glycogen debranching enzyme
MGIYEGDVWKRDGSYHQGTVWPWLMGPFLTAYVKVNGRSAKSRQQAKEWLEPFRQHLSEGGLGSVSEILDADPPHLPRGCYAQAWSVAELLRAAVEDIYGVRPEPSNAGKSSVDA